MRSACAQAFRRVLAGLLVLTMLFLSGVIAGAPEHVRGHHAMRMAMVAQAGHPGPCDGGGCGRANDNLPSSCADARAPAASGWLPAVATALPQPPLRVSAYHRAIARVVLGIGTLPALPPPRAVA